MNNLQHWDDDWESALAALGTEVHAVDREALRVWFALFPLGTLDLIPDEAARTFYQMKGSWSLAGQEDRSHRFLYAHAWWGEAKRAALQGFPTQGLLEDALAELAAQIQAPQEFRLALAALVLMTIRQAGTEFLARPFSGLSPRDSPAKRLEQRAKPPTRSFFGPFLRQTPKLEIVFDEGRADARFPILDAQDITTAAELDKRPYHETDPRCYAGMGPIPVDCRSGSCGTCWIGILGGKENLEAPTSFERKRMEYFGYWDSPFADPTSQHPRLRLACQAKARGSVSIVIPPWNGVFGLTRRTKERRNLA